MLDGYGVDENMFILSCNYAWMVFEWMGWKDLYHFIPLFFGELLDLVFSNWWKFPGSVFLQTKRAALAVSSFRCLENGLFIGSVMWIWIETMALTLVSESYLQPHSHCTILGFGWSGDMGPIDQILPTTTFTLHHVVKVWLGPNWSIYYNHTHIVPCDWGMVGSQLINILALLFVWDIVSWLHHLCLNLQLV